MWNYLWSLSNTDWLKYIMSQSKKIFQLQKKGIRVQVSATALLCPSSWAHWYKENMIRKRSLLTDVVKNCKRATECFAQTVNSVRLPCMQNKKNVHCTKSFCLYCSTLYRECESVWEIHLCLISFKGLILLENKGDLDLWGFRFFQIWHTKFQRIMVYIWKIKGTHLGISLGYSSSCSAAVVLTTL